MDPKIHHLTRIAQRNLPHCRKLGQASEQDRRRYKAASYMTIEEEEVYVTIEQEAVKQKKKRAEKKPSKEMSHIKCFSCDQMGHYSNKCPNKNNQDDEDEGEVHSSWHEEQEAGMYMIMVSWADNEEVNDKDSHNAVHATEGLLLTKVLLDNQANISIVHPMLLEDIRPAPRRIKVNGVGEKQMIVDKMGLLPGFFRVYASKGMKANVLCFSDVNPAW